MNGGKVRERGRHRITSRLQVPSCQHRARCRARTHGTRDHDLSRSRSLNRLSHPGAPQTCFFRGPWGAQSVKRPTSAQVMMSWFMGLSPASGSVLTAQSLEPAWDSVSPSLSDLPPTHVMSVSLSKMKSTLKKKRKYQVDS